MCDGLIKTERSLCSQSGGAGGFVFIHLKAQIPMREQRETFGRYVCGNLLANFTYNPLRVHLDLL